MLKPVVAAPDYGCGAGGWRDDLVDELHKQLALQEQGDSTYCGDLFLHMLKIVAENVEVGNLAIHLD